MTNKSDKHQQEKLGETEVHSDREIEEIKELKEERNECAEWKEKAQEFENKFKRAIADYQNLEKRMRDERGMLVLSANKELLLRFLPILDTLILAQQHDQNPTLGIVVNQFLDTLKSEHVTKVKTVGEKFDPETMEVVTTLDGKEGIVIQEVRAGYLLHDRLLRPAQVIVGNGEKKASSN